MYVSRAFPSKIFEYEIFENVWSNEIECPRNLSSLAVLNGQLTLVGGGATLSSLMSNILLSLIDNPTMVGTKQWSEICKPMQKMRMRPAVASNSSYFVAAGGDWPGCIYLKNSRSDGTRYTRMACTIRLMVILVVQASLKTSFIQHLGILTLSHSVLLSHAH